MRSSERWKLIAEIAKGNGNTMSDKRYHELHEWNESLE